MPKLVFFDLDNTLIGGDSDYLFGEYLAEQNLLDANFQRQQNQQFYEDYKNQALNIYDYLQFALRVFDEIDYQTLLKCRESFAQLRIKPLIYQQGLELIKYHQERQDTLIINTATNRFIVEPIAKMLHIEQLICTEVYQQNGRYTSRLERHNYGQNKVANIHLWLQQKALTRNDFEATVAYSDSITDQPLLEFVNQAYAVNADTKLQSLAQQKGWQLLNFSD